MFGFLKKKEDKRTKREKMHRVVTFAIQFAKILLNHASSIKQVYNAIHDHNVQSNTATFT